MGKPFRPANGTEGEIFMGRWCSRCKHDDPDAGVYCQIIVAAMTYKVDDPRYPQEWRATDVCDPSTWLCTKFEMKVENMKA